MKILLKRHRQRRLVSSVFAAALAATCTAGKSAAEAAGLPPDAVTIPQGLNLGDTSFFDGFASVIPGTFGLLEYFKYEDLNKITTPTGGSNPAFNNPHINTAINVLQGAYISHIHVPNGVLGLQILQPVVNINSHFDSPGVALRNNGLGFGDTTFGGFYESIPFVSSGRPVLAFRLEFDSIAPTGSFSKTRDLNQGSGYWSLVPFLAFTVLPTPRLEFSSRIQYLYNFSTNQAPNPPPIPGFQFQTGQAGQAVFLNFAGSYSVASWLNVGVNGFYLKQITNDTVNRISLAGTEKQELYLGPGVHIPFDRRSNNTLNLNLYLPIETRGMAQGPQVNAQFTHGF